MLAALRQLLAVSALFLFNDPAPTEIYTLSLHDALPISLDGVPVSALDPDVLHRAVAYAFERDRKSTRLNSSHERTSYAVFGLKKKKGADDITGVLGQRIQVMQMGPRHLLSAKADPSHAPLYRPVFFFFNDTAPTEIYTLSLHDALPI